MYDYFVPFEKDQRWIFQFVQNMIHNFLVMKEFIGLKLVMNIMSEKQILQVL